MPRCDRIHLDYGFKAWGYDKKNDRYMVFLDGDTTKCSVSITGDQTISKQLAETIEKQLNIISKKIIRRENDMKRKIKVLRKELKELREGY